MRETLTAMLLLMNLALSVPDVSRSRRWRKYAPSTAARGNCGSDCRSTDSLFFQPWPISLSGRSYTFSTEKGSSSPSRSTRHIQLSLIRLSP